MTVKNFHKADLNHDGAVTEEELATAAARSHQMANFMRGADTNHNGAVTKQEALNYYGSKEGPVN